MEQQQQKIQHRGELSVHQYLLSSYIALRRMAGTLMRGERCDHTLEPTALVHEAVLRILRRESRTFNDETHFFHTVIREMRRVLIDAARKCDAATLRGLSQHLLATDLPAPQIDRLDLLALDEAIDALEQIDEKQAQIAQLRIFFGLSNAEIARMLGMSLRSVERKWAVARSRIAISIDHDRKFREG